MNKIAIAQIDLESGNILFNKNKIIECIKKAQADKADLIVFPAYALSGFPLGNIFERNKDLYKIQKAALEEIAQSAQNIAAVIGYYENGAACTALIQDGILQENARRAVINSIKYGILSDESSFDAGEFNKPDSIILCGCTPSRTGSEYKKHSSLSSAALKHCVNIIYVNKAGYADNFVFEGASRVYSSKGNLICRLKAFEEDFAVLDDYKGAVCTLPSGAEKAFDINDFKINYENDLERTYKSIIFALKQYFSKNGFSKAVLGLSGGLDSSVCAVLLADALGAENVQGVSMPAQITSKESRTDAQILAQNLGINFFEAPLMPALGAASDMLEKAYQDVNAEQLKTSAAAENLQARMRAVILWSISNKFKGMLPIATSDKSEAYIGYAAVNGDMSGGFAPIADVSKTKLFMLADWMNKNRPVKNAVPQSILNKPPGAELKLNPKTGRPVYAEEDNMPYEFLDEVLHLAENKHSGRDELLEHRYFYETKHNISLEQKTEWIEKFFRKSKAAVYKWHIMPPSVIIDAHSINSAEYRCPVISKVY